MKKILLCLLSILMFSTISIFASKFSCEPESDTSVSYGVYDIPRNNIDMTFEKLATSNGHDEYWIRMSERTGAREKLLYYIYLNIDGKQHKINSMAPCDRHIMASQEFVAGSLQTFMRTSYRYYPLTPEIVSALIAAKSVSMTYGKNEFINIPITISDDYLAKIKNTYKLTYSDYSQFWKPKQWN